MFFGRRFIFVASLLVVLLLVLLYGNFGMSSASSPGVYHGDLELYGDNVTVIEYDFAINGSIYLYDNATLIIRRCMIGVMQNEDYEHAIEFDGESSSFARLVIEDVVVDQDFEMKVNIRGNGTAEVSNLTTDDWFFQLYETGGCMFEDSSIWYIHARDESRIEARNVEMFEGYVFDHAKVELTRCNMDSFWADGEVEAVLTDCDTSILGLWIYHTNFTIEDRRPGWIKYWSFRDNETVEVQPLGQAPYISLYNTTIESWRYAFQDESQATWYNSSFGGIYSYDSLAEVLNCDSPDGMVRTYSSGRAIVENSTVYLARTHQVSRIWLVNSTAEIIRNYHYGSIYVPAWYIDVQVIDALGDPVGSANVTAYHNATAAAEGVTGRDGWIRFVLGEEMTNATDTFTLRNYEIEARHLQQLARDIIVLDAHRTVELRLPEVVVGEDIAPLILSLLMVLNCFTKFKQIAM